MKSYLLAFVPLVLLGFQPEHPISAQKLTSDQPAVLVPTNSQKEVEKLVTSILSSYHYRRMPLDDTLSNKVWDNYLKEIDNGKAYLLSSDVQAFEKYRYQIDDYLQAGNLTPAYDLFNLFMKRFHERMAYVKKLTDKPFDFTKDETYETNRDKVSWAQSPAELDELWQKIIKSQALDYKLQGKADTAINRTLKDRYTNLEKQFSKVKSEYVFQTFMNSFAEVIDPHTNYMAPPDASRFKDEMAQSFEGIGATLTPENDYTKVRELLVGGPAMKSGLVQVNDRIVGVAQGEGGQMVDVVGWNLDDVVKLIRGPKGTTVRLNILKADAAAGSLPKEIKIVRDKIKLEEGVAKAEVVPMTFEKKEYKIGVITLPGFYQNYEEMRKGDKDYTSTTRDVQRFLDQFKDQKVDGVVLDLRYNGGGSLDEAIKLTGLFIKQGPVVQVKDAMGRIDVDDDTDPQQVYAGPLAVLVNRFSASASEIFAGAIQDYKRGVIIGGTTYGKGTVQQLLDLNQFLPKEPEKVGLLKMTRAKFYRITGSSTQHKGVTPDIELPSRFSAEEFGESSQPTALPWDQIRSSTFVPYNSVTPATLEKLRERYDQRSKLDTDLLRLNWEVADFQKNKDKTLVSLNEATRRKEIEEMKKRKEELSKLNAGKTNPYEVVLLGDKITQLGAAGGGMPGQDVASANTRQKMKENFIAKFKDDAELKETTRILADLISIKQ
ncbi:carboxy terminal-processing peptidase [Siphonobacter aquaeclarae]|uniref:Carboxyl-terminal processing protease n=1 Tax=Siphonobacter aquaeclarae TaxID=563176 RepID=A0A1G9SUE1_9BACT|nr:carboxy terminal-processing peptidase [Siphonobacter aquaeclarae]SDM39021.1 carboxyl-terminal processing protease [Siphonobacter aquaeclarae]